MAMYMYMKTGLINDTEEGPHSLDEMAQLVAKRVLNPSTLCTRGGDTQWRTVGDYPEIAQRVAEFAQQAEQQRAEQQRVEQQRAEQQRAQQAQHPTPQKPAQQSAPQQPAPQQPSPHARPASASSVESPFTPSGDSTPQQPIVRPRKQRRKTVVFDIFFTRFVTPTAVTALWILSILGYVGGFLFLLIMSLVGSFAAMTGAEATAAAGGATMLISLAYLLAYLLVGGLYLLIYRILLECIMVIFRCSQSLDLIAGREPPFEV